MDIQTRMARIRQVFQNNVAENTLGTLENIHLLSEMAGWDNTGKAWDKSDPQFSNWNKNWNNWDQDWNKLIDDWKKKR